MDCFIAYLSVSVYHLRFVDLFLSSERASESFYLFFISIPQFNDPQWGAPVDTLMRISIALEVYYHFILRGDISSACLIAMIRGFRKRSTVSPVHEAVG